MLGHGHNFPTPCAAGFCFTTHGRNNSSFHKIKQYDKQIDKEYYDKHGGSIEVGSRSKDLYIEARVVASAIVGAIRETKDVIGYSVYLKPG